MVQVCTNEFQILGETIFRDSKTLLAANVELIFRVNMGPRMAINMESVRLTHLQRIEVSETLRV